MSMAELIAKKKKQQQARKAGSTKTTKPQPGKHMYRILPSWLGQKDEEGNPNPWWHDFGQHWIRTSAKGKPEAVFVCTEKTFDAPCEVCMAIGRGIKGSSDDEQIDLLKQANASQRFLVNALHLNGDAPNEPILMEVGSTVFDQLLDICEDIDITDPEKGINIVINRTGSGFDTSYNVLPSPKGASPLKDKSILANLHDISAFVMQDGEAAEAKALSAIGKAVGIEAPAAAALPSTTATNALAELDDAIDAEFEPAPIETAAETADASSADDIGDDELDELLADLG